KRPRKLVLHRRHALVCWPGAVTRMGSGTGRFMNSPSPAPRPRATSDLEAEDRRNKAVANCSSGMPRLLTPVERKAPEKTLPKTSQVRSQDMMVGHAHAGSRRPEHPCLSRQVTTTGWTLMETNCNAPENRRLWLATGTTPPAAESGLEPARKATDD